MTPDMLKSIYHSHHQQGLKDKRRERRKERDETRRLIIN